MALEISTKSIQKLAPILEEKFKLYYKPDFIPQDPILLPHQFSLKQDVEIAGFIAATLAWGNRKSIIQSAQRFLTAMDNAPYDFIVNAKPTDLKSFERFVHRTFNADDALGFISSLKHIYTIHPSMESAFAGNGLKSRISNFRTTFFEAEHLPRTRKHVSNPESGSAAKRLCMFLRWMVRPNDSGIDFGIWKNIPTAQLIMPLDVHTGNVARKLGLLLRKQNDWQAAENLTAALRVIDPLDPVRFDFALFGMGVNKDT